MTNDVIQRAVSNGLTGVVYGFSNWLCTDHRRAINQMEKYAGQHPEEIFQLWLDYLQPRGYRIRYQIVDFSGGVPGDIGVTIPYLRTIDRAR